MYQRTDATKITGNELAKIFVDCINNATIDDLSKTYLGDVIDEDEMDEEGKPVGMFRLIHIFNEEQTNYVTFTASFCNDANGSKKLKVYCMEKKEFVLECTYNPAKYAWISNKPIADIAVSAITNMAVKLKSILP